MKKLKSEVSVGVLKNELSAYIKLAKAGDEIVITDHKHPVAKIIPFVGQSEDLAVIAAKSDLSFLIQLSEQKSGVKDYQTLKGLNEDRGNR